MIITERDTEILKMCLEQKFLLLRHIAKKFFPESLSMYKVPARRVNLLMRQGYLKAVKPRVGHDTLYLTTAQGVKHLRSLDLSNGLRPLDGVDLKIYEHDVWVTDARIVLERSPGLIWTPERVLKHKTERRKVPDGLADDGRENSFVIEIERTLKSKRYYDRVLIDTWVKNEGISAFLYLVGKKSMVEWFKKLECCPECFYFATMEDLLRREGNTLFVNKKNSTLILNEHVESDEDFVDEYDGPHKAEAECRRLEKEEFYNQRYKRYKGGAVSDPSGS
ncbi:MAG TPA: hypothetical protein PK590_05060 [Candidatus Omnitrophota bacterium]|nr:hypothetical protein [Candidatus Omnitrophota bacterium]